MTEPQSHWTLERAPERREDVFEVTQPVEWLKVSCLLSACFSHHIQCYTIITFIVFFIPSFFLSHCFLIWGLVALQCCVNFCCRAKWISYTYTCIFSLSHTHTHTMFIVFSSCPQGVFQGSGVNFRWRLHGRQDSVLFMRCSAHGYLIIPVGGDMQTWCGFTYKDGDYWLKKGQRKGKADS